MSSASKFGRERKKEPVSKIFIDLVYHADKGVINREKKLPVKGVL
jgi:hypothetical protein